jgi:hypothetical protein
MAILIGLAMAALAATAAAVGDSAPPASGDTAPPASSDAVPPASAYAVPRAPRSVGTVAPGDVPVAAEVEARRLTLEKQVKAFVAEITHRVDDESIPRWRRPLCPLVAGLSRDQGEYVLSRLSSVALAAGVPLGKSSCRANFYVVVTNEPAAVVRAIKKRNSAMFGGAAPSVVRRFIERQVPVRAWHNLRFEGPAGNPAITSGPRDYTHSVGRGGIPTRLDRIFVQTIYSTIVVVDGQHVAGLEVRQLADYVAMVGMVDLADFADTSGVPTILRLFADRTAAPRGLTEWDSAFLGAVYDTRQEDVLQRSEISRRIVRDLGRSVEE